MKILRKYQTLRTISALAAVLLVTNCGNIVSDSDAETAINCSNGCSWSHQAYLKAPNAGANDFFGDANSVSISGDTIVVGAYKEDSNQTTITTTPGGTDTGADNSGAAYVFVRSGTTWSHQAYLKAPNAGADDYFGWSVAVSGDTIVVGAYAEDSNQTGITNGTSASSDNSASSAGAAYVFVRSGTSWSHQAYLKAPNAEGGDQFGNSVSISGDTIVVSANSEDSNQTTITNGTTIPAESGTTNFSGAAYVFVRSGTTWSHQAYLKAPNASGSDYFGFVSISGDTIAVGAKREDSNQTTITNGTTVGADPGTANDSGAAYVFVRNGTAWSHQAYLKAPNASNNDFFGEPLAISGDTIVVGTFFEDSNQTTITNGSTVGADPGTASNSGAAYVFVRSGTTWSHQAYLKAPNAEADDYFGYRLAVSGDTIVVGAFQEDSNQTGITNGTSASSDNSASSAGAAYVFVRSGTSWSHQAYLKAPNAEADDDFGRSVAIDGTTIVVGAHQEDSDQTTVTTMPGGTDASSTANVGAAYVFVGTPN